MYAPSPFVFTTASKDEVVSILVGVLTPYVGPTMASASVRGLCDKLVPGRSTLGRPEVQRLVDALAPGLHVYIGKDKARSVVERLWSALDGGVGGRP